MHKWTKYHQNFLKHSIPSKHGELLVWFSLKHEPLPIVNFVRAHLILRDDLIGMRAMYVKVCITHPQIVYFRTKLNSLIEIKNILIVL